MPIGEAVGDVDADRYRVTVEEDSDGGTLVGHLLAEIFDEDALAYTSSSRGDLRAVDRLDD